MMSYIGLFSLAIWVVLLQRHSVSSRTVAVLFLKFDSLYKELEAPDFRALLTKNRPYGQAKKSYIGHHWYIGQYVVYH